MYSEKEGSHFRSGCEIYLQLGKPYIISNQRFRAIFGAPPSVEATVWNLIKINIPNRRCQKHLLWALHFFKSYTAELKNCVVFKCDKSG